MSTKNTKTTGNLKRIDLCSINAKTGLIRHHIQKRCTGKSKLRKAFAKVLMGIGLDLKDGCTLTVEHGTASLRACNQ